MWSKDLGLRYMTGYARDGDGYGIDMAEHPPPKLPPEHLFTCTVGRNRSQARYPLLQALHNLQEGGNQATDG